MEQLFQNAKVGDKVIDYRFGRGNVFQVDDDKKPIGVEFKTGPGWFGMNGKMFDDHPGPTCFPIDKAPQHLLDMFPEEKPKRMETVKTSGIVDKNGRSVAWCSSPEDAAKLAAPYPDLSVVLLSGEYEVSA